MLPVSRAIPKIPSITNTARHFFSKSNTMSTTRTYKLNSGAEIPAVGLGTWQSQPGQVEKAVEAALRAGYTHIDTAYAYGNEKEVGQGIKASGVPREKIWLTTKLDNDWHKHVAEAIDTSLKNLDTPYVDLYLMHWPASLDKENPKQVYNDWDFVDTWREMQKLVDTGKVKNIGVSNFGVKNLEKLLNAESTKIVPAVNQIELHPGNPSPNLVKYCASKGIHCTGYSPLGSSDSPLYKNETLAKIAESKGKTIQQVLLQWGVSKGWSVLPKSVTEERIKANFDLDGWSLTDEDIAQIDKIHETSSFKVCGHDWLPVKIFFGAGDSD
ncbi:NADP-dependent oxidoreductase domain-containing protein [Sordaria brevicollis]|uniref:NADP-dependent oxidoreductase domain-containing protein n=1 Tax=Sordaria brevicollis TaxID=83679 RepID=A0AAE0PI04_SORBR|nr:NADP-dependent oxidoreductase domain-containing protein [Sordaria brevicollis]